MLILEILYIIIVAWLSIYGFNALYLTVIRKFHQTRSEGSTPAQDLPDPDIVWPSVTVQLPVYNERYVIERLINAIGSLDYPTDRLEIQVLDDSDDITSDIIAQLVSAQRSRGLNIHHIQRPTREGYKGGALSYGMEIANGEFIAIFDADFIPEPDTLKKIIPHFIDKPGIGCIQARR